MQNILAIIHVDSGGGEAAMASAAPPAPAWRCPPEQGRHAMRSFRRISFLCRRNRRWRRADRASAVSNHGSTHHRLDAQAAAGDQKEGRGHRCGHGHGHVRPPPPPADRFAAGVAVSSSLVKTEVRKLCKFHQNLTKFLLFFLNRR